MGSYRQGQEWRGRQEYSHAGHETRGQQGSMEQRGRHFGKGPKGYTRSDERLKEEISDSLMQCPDIDASNISIQVKDGEVSLEGSVDDRMAKRMVEDMVEDVMGVKDVTNRLKIQRTSRHGEDGDGDTAFGGHSQGSSQSSTQSGSAAGQSSKQGKHPQS